MGGTGSTRRIVVEDAEGEGVVKITEDVARRIRGQPDLPAPVKRESTPPPSPPVMPRKDPIPDVRDKDVEDFYVRKLKELQERNAALQHQTNDQFAKAVKEVEEKFVNVTASPVCQDLQSLVLQCYQANPNEVLNCSGIVGAFTACVDRARMAASTSRMQTIS